MERSSVLTAVIAAVALAAAAILYLSYGESRPEHSEAAARQEPEADMNAMYEELRAAAEAEANAAAEARAAAEAALNNMTDANLAGLPADLPPPEKGEVQAGVQQPAAEPPAAPAPPPGTSNVLSRRVYDRRPASENRAAPPPDPN